MKLSIITFLVSVWAGLVFGQVGEEAQDFTLYSLDHGRITLSDFRGKVVLVSFLYSF